MLNKPIGLFGGTFDPIHHGHLQTAERLCTDLKLTQIFFILCKQPVLKPAARATAQQRLDMLALALKNYSQFTVDKRELTRDTPSYTIDTLKSYQQEMPNTPLYFILGIDAFLQLPQWYQWQQLLDYCHLIIINRPNYKIDNH